MALARIHKVHSYLQSRSILQTFPESFWQKLFPFVISPLDCPPAKLIRSCHRQAGKPPDI